MSLRTIGRPAERDGARTEEVHLRNYDLNRGHRVWLNVVSDGDRVFETTVRLPPDGVESLAGALPPGTYDVEVGVDGLRRATARCRVDDVPARTVLVELGNGVVSVTEGLP